MRQTIKARIERARFPEWGINPSWGGLNPSWGDRARVLLGQDWPLSVCSPQHGCWVKGEGELTELALACDQHIAVPSGVMVRHADLAAQMDRAPGGPAALLARVGARKVDLSLGQSVLGVAIAGSYTVASAIINRRHYGGGEWAAGWGKAIGTGTDPSTAERRRNLYELLDQGAPVTPAGLALCDRVAMTTDLGEILEALKAGYTAYEITPELLADKMTLKVAIAISSYTGDWFGDDNPQTHLKPYR